MASKVKKQYVIAKQGKYATVAGGLGSRPKVYPTAAAAQYDISSNNKLKGGIIQPYVDPDAPAETNNLPMASTSKSKTKAGTAKTATPKRAVSGK